MDIKDFERQIRDVYTTLMYGLIKLNKRINNIEPGSGNVNTVNGKTGDVVLDASDVGAIASIEKGAANGVSTLGNDGKVPSSQLPSILGGHTIEDAAGTAMTARNNLQFTGCGVSVTDDSTNNRTVILIETVNTFTIATSAWVANTGSDAAAFPYVAEITTALYSSMFVPCEVLLLGADPSDYPTSTDETAISMVDKYIKFTGTDIRLRAKSAPATNLKLVVRG